jgi:hypothetical protein
MIPPEPRKRYGQRSEHWSHDQADPDDMQRGRSSTLDSEVGQFEENGQQVLKT